MKCICKRITALILVLLLTASLLASCSKGAGEPENAVTEVDGIPIFDRYKSRKIDLGLWENETIFDIIEIDGQLRATVGFLDPAFDPEHPDDYRGLPYPTEHRWYGLDYVEDVEKRKKTIAYQEITFPANSDTDFVFGGEPVEDEWYKGLVYHLYLNGEIQDDILVASDMAVDDPSATAFQYSPIGHCMIYQETLFISINYGGLSEAGVTYRGEWAGLERLYVNGKFVDTQKWNPGDPKYTYYGMIGIEGIPYALLEVEDKGYLTPLTPDMTELSLDGTKIDGCPTGGAFTDGRFGYFMSGSELWRTDGKESKCIADLVPYGVTLSSAVRSVRALSDGRILVTVDGKVIELSELAGEAEALKVCDVAVLDYDGQFGDLTLSVSRYNDQAENAFIRIKEYDDEADLNLALLSGEVDMVITPNQFILKNYIKQGLLASLDEVAPALFEKDVLIENIVDATRVDGTCYYLPVNFELRGEYIANPGLLKEDSLFASRTDYYNYIIQYDNEYFMIYTPRQILDNFSRDLDEWIDWETNTAHFDDGTFAALLEFCSRGSTQEEIAEYINSQTPFQNQWGHKAKAGSFTLTDGVESYRFDDVKKAQDYQKELPVTEGVGGPATWVHLDFSMPSSVHDGYEIDAHNLYAVVDHGEGKQAAADFLQWLILEDVEEDFPEKETTPFLAAGWDGFSINKDETDRYLRRLIDGYVDPEDEVATIKPEVVSQFPSIVNTIRYEVQNYDMRCGQTQYEVTWNYIEKADHLRYHENEIHKVIVNEAASFFSGSITASQAADYIQNRISIYLAEQG